MMIFHDLCRLFDGYFKVVKGPLHQQWTSKRTGAAPCTVVVRFKGRGGLMSGTMADDRGVVHRRCRIRPDDVIA